MSFEREASMIGQSIQAGLEEIARAIVESAAKQQLCLHKWSDTRSSNVGGWEQTCRHCNEVRLIK